MKNFYQKGITLWEVLLVIAILGILSVVVLPGFSKIKKTQMLTGVTEEIVSVIGKARSQTLSSVNSSSYGVHFETNRVIIFTGISYVSGATDNEIINLPSPVTISSINLSDITSSVYFNRLSGLPSTTGNITLSVPNITSKIITISAIGSVSVN